MRKKYESEDFLFVCPYPASTREQRFMVVGEVRYGGSSEKRKKKFAVQSSTGIRHVGKVKSALMFATLAQHSGYDTFVHCVQDGLMQSSKV